MAQDVISSFIIVSDYLTLCMIDNLTDRDDTGERNISRRQVRMK
jgi:hypothetical protein